MYFYPRSPCGERPYGRINDISRLIFLSTLSLRRATQACLAVPHTLHISIHALLAESDALAMAGYTKAEIISIHALLAESDLADCTKFQRIGISIHALLAESDTSLVVIGTNCIISIHALLAESDEYWVGGYGTSNNFYPRSPCGERLGAITYVVMTPDFYPRSPCGERLDYYAV